MPLQQSQYSWARAGTPQACADVEHISHRIICTPSCLPALLPQLLLLLYRTCEPFQLSPLGYNATIQSTCLLSVVEIVYCTQLLSLLVCVPQRHNNCRAGCKDDEQDKKLLGTSVTHVFTMTDWSSLNWSTTEFGSAVR